MIKKAFTLIGFILFFHTNLIAQSTHEKTLDNLYLLLQQEAYLPLLDRCDFYLSNAPNQLEESFKADLITLKGNTLRKLEQANTALLLHQEALQIRQKLYGNQSLKVSSSFLNIGNCYLDLNNYPEALLNLEQSKKIKEYHLGINDKGWIKIYTSLGMVHQLLNQLDSALFFLEKAIDVQQPIPQNHATLIPLQNQKATILAKMGRFDQAIQLVQQALQEKEQTVNQNTNHQAACLQTIGNCYLELSDWQNASIYYHQALQLFSNTADKVGVKNSLGLLLFYQGKTEEAANQFTEGISQLLENSADSDSYLLALLYSNLGNCYLRQQTSSPALFYFEKAGTIFKNENHIIDLANNHNKIGQAYFQQKKYQAAKNAYQKALSITNHSTIIYSSNFLLGELMTTLKQPKKAIAFYQLAAKGIGIRDTISHTIFPYETVQINIALADVWHQIATDSQQAKDWQTSLDYADKAINLLEKLKGQFNNSASAIDLQHTFYDAYNLAVQASFNLNNTELAFQYSDACKGSILNKLARQNQLKSSHSTDSLWQKEIQLNKTISYFQQKKYELERINNSLVNPSEIEAINTQLFQLEQAKIKLTEQLVKVHPSYLFLKTKDPNKTIQNIQQALSKEETILQYQWAGTELYTFLINKDTFEVFKIEDATKMEQSIKRLYLLSSQSPVWAGENALAQFEELVQTAHFLHEQLITPYQHLLKKKLRIIPDTWLYYLPFESLISQRAIKANQFNKHHYLLENHQIQYAYKVNEFIQKTALSKTNYKHTLLAIAPAFNEGNLRLKALQFNRQEAKQVCLIMNGHILEAEAATEYNYISQVADYQIVHLSTHGIINEENPAFSYLAFSQTTSTENPELLYVNEIQTTPINAELVVLSACQTANGKLVRGEGLLSLAQAFFTAGAKSLVASLWNVDDKQTPALLKSFYQYLDDGKEKSFALQQAKLKYLKNASSDTAHPYYWAGFIGMGTDKPLEVANGFVYWKVGLGMLCSLVLLFLLKNRYSQA